MSSAGSREPHRGQLDRSEAKDSGENQRKGSLRDKKLEEKLKQLIEEGKRDGYITYDRFNEIFPRTVIHQSASTRSSPLSMPTESIFGTSH